MESKKRANVFSGKEIYTTFLNTDLKSVHDMPLYSLITLYMDRVIDPSDPYYENLTYIIDRVFSHDEDIAIEDVKRGLRLESTTVKRYIYEKYLQRTSEIDGNGVRVFIPGNNSTVNIFDYKSENQIINISMNGLVKERNDMEIEITSANPYITSDLFSIVQQKRCVMLYDVKGNTLEIVSQGFRKKYKSVSDYFHLRVRVDSMIDNGEIRVETTLIVDATDGKQTPDDISIMVDMCKDYGCMNVINITN